MMGEQLNQETPGTPGTDTPVTAVESALERIAARYCAPSSHRVDYGAAAVSDEYEALRHTASALADLDPDRLADPHSAVAFWINLYNLLTLHIVLSGPIATSVREREDFFTGPYYRVAGQALTLDAIEHGILRGNARRYMGLKPLFSSGDPRLRWSLRTIDPRIHFALYTANMSSPPLRAIPVAQAETALDNATREQLAATVRVDPSGRTARLPRVFRWYTGDFGGSIDDALAFVRRHLDDNRADALADEDINVEFDPFDWRLNDRYPAGG
ncbi:DUF547 domain-containing protein [Halofilum ochraceum]|uniref:DUF547 domain-containing protein n=1 Tax=Halofilum ochraceum TaxID=1611323 RepID=UPI000835C556|nr:DUF547 domain-containing protein [Halofilum ochraceum]